MARSWHRRAPPPFTSSTASRTRLTVDWRWSCCIPCCLRRLEGEIGPIRQLGQSLFDQFCRDMDANMREMGVGDLAVPRRMRRIGEAFYGRQAVYRTALDAPGNDRLVAALHRNVFAGGGDRGGANRLTVYVRETERRLAAEDGFEGAQFAFPDPEEVFVRAPQPTVEQ